MLYEMSWNEYVFQSIKFVSKLKLAFVLSLLGN